MEWIPRFPLSGRHLLLEGGQEVQELIPTSPPILIPNTQVYAYTNEEKANAIALNLESQFQGNIIVEYNSEREVNDSVRMFLREDIPPPF